MPSYVYECEECGEFFEAFHSITYDLEECQVCNSSGCLNRIPEMPNYTIKKKAGKVVKEYIEQVRQEVKQEKQDMSKDYTK